MPHPFTQSHPDRSQEATQHLRLHQIPGEFRNEVRLREDFVSAPKAEQIFHRPEEWRDSQPERAAVVRGCDMDQDVQENGDKAEEPRTFHPSADQRQESDDNRDIERTKPDITQKTKTI